MKTKLSPRLLPITALGVLVVTLLLPLQSTQAGGCCFTEVTIKSLDTSRQVVMSGPALTAPYDLSTFWSFSDFSQRVSKPSRSGPAYEVARDGWDHLIYYPSVGNQPGVVYYEGLFNGSSEYDHQWYLVPPEQDQALRQALASQGFPSGAASHTLTFVLTGLAVVGLLLAIGSLWFFPLRYSRIRANAWATRQK